MKFLVGGFLLWVAMMLEAASWDSARQGLSRYKTQATLAAIFAFAFAWWVKNG